MKKCCHKYWRRKTIFRSLSLWNMFSSFPRTMFSALDSLPFHRHRQWRVIIRERFLSILREMPAQHRWLCMATRGRIRFISFPKRFLRWRRNFEIAAGLFEKIKKKNIGEKTKKIMKIVKHKIWCRRIFFAASEFSSYSWQPHQR